MNNSNKKLYLIIRILGNDLNGLHGNNQTIKNLKFTLKNEYMFKDTKKMFVLNRIINIKKKKKIIKLLNYYNFEFIDIQFDINEFNKLPKNIPTLSEYKNYDKNNMVKILEKHNLYLINNNGCRNYCISYGKKSGYTWTFVLDSNSFFTKKTFENIVNNINMNDKYLIIPQKRLNDGNLSNKILLTKDYKNKLNRLPNREPQIAFKNTSKIMFNSNIPYCLAPKAELLYALNVKGKWKKWMEFHGLDIKPRTFKNKKYKKLSYVIRLSPYNNNNNMKNNWELRWIGIYLLVKQINSRTS